MPHKAVCAMLCILGAYAIYMHTNPTDGVLFGTVMLALGALGGSKLQKVIASRT